MRGFTLVEILVAIAIITIVGTMIVAIFASTLRGSSKAQILAVIKQNGQASMEIMDKTIRNADNVICVSSDRSAIAIRKSDIYTRFKFVAPTGTANGYLQQDNPVLPGDLCSGLPINSLVLTDTNPQSGVSVDSGSFIKDKPYGTRDEITIKFTLKPGLGVPSALSGQIDPVAFQTSVYCRNCY